MADKSAHKAKVRDRILDEAAASLRSGGTDGISVANLMKRVGLTHGGFYAHFDSRDDLVAHAVDRMFADSAAMLARYLPDGAGIDGLFALIDYYLSETTMQRHDRGCPLPWLAGEAPRMPQAAQTRFRAGIANMCCAIEHVLRDSGQGDCAKALAAATVAQLVGAMALARATGGGNEALAILTAAREAIKHRLLAAG